MSLFRYIQPLLLYYRGTGTCGYAGSWGRLWNLPVGPQRPSQSDGDHGVRDVDTFFIIAHQAARDRSESPRFSPSDSRHAHARGETGEAQPEKLKNDFSRSL